MAVERKRDLDRAIKLVELVNSSQHFDRAAVESELGLGRRSAYRWIEAAIDLGLVEWTDPDALGGSKGVLRNARIQRRRKRRN